MSVLDRLAATLAGVEAVPGDAREQIALALAYAERGALAAAELRLEELARAHGQVGAVWAALGEVRARRDDSEGAASAFSRSVDLYPGAPEAWLGLGEALVRLGRGDPARDALRRVLATTEAPSLRARAHAARGRLALRAGQAAKAVAELRRATELGPDDVKLAADLGRALGAAGEPDGWQWLLRAAQAPGADDALVIEAAAAAPGPQGEALLRGAIAATAAADHPVRARLHAGLAHALLKQRRTDEAEAAAQQAVTVGATEVAAFTALRMVAEATGRHVVAQQAAQQEAALGSPPDAVTVLRLALGAEDAVAIASAGETAGLDPTLAAAARGVASAAPVAAHLDTLAPLCPTASARRFLARSLSPGEPPPGNLYALLAFAHDLAARTPALAALAPTAARALEAFDRPLCLAIMGEFNAGKSSFVNALCGEQVAPVGVTPTTATINVLRHGAPGARVLHHDGRAQELTTLEATAFLARVDGTDAADIRAVEIFLPLSFLQTVEIVDTPGWNALSPAHARAARGFLDDADAIVWLFSADQAGKASERDVLDLAAAAGKRVLGVLNKADQLDAAELDGLLAHTRAAFGDRLEALLPLSARDAVRARQTADDLLRAGSGLPAVVAALEQRFFGHARELKRRTALGAIGRFVVEATAASGPGDPPEEVAARFAAGRRDLDAHEAVIHGALAAERVALPARLATLLAQAADDIAGLAPGRGLLDRPPEASTEDGVTEICQDIVDRATETTRIALEHAVKDGPAVPVSGVVERFGAFARGLLVGGLASRILTEDLDASGGRVDLRLLGKRLARRAPATEAELFTPLAHEVRVAFARARAELSADEARAQMRALVHEERLTRPLQALAAARATLDAMP